MSEEIKINGCDINLIDVESLNEYIEAIRAEIGARKKEEINEIKTKILSLSEATGMDLDDLLSELSGKSNGKGKKPKKVVKYRNAEGLTWSGRGKRPAWIHAEITAGNDIEQYRVDEN